MLPEIALRISSRPCNDPLKALLSMVCWDGQQTLEFRHSSQFLFGRQYMEHPSASDFSQTEFPIKNALDRSPIH
jgi:hypothetical protein